MKRKLHEAKSSLKPYEVEFYVENLATHDSTYVVLPASDSEINSTYKRINNSNKKSEVYMQPTDGFLAATDIYSTIEKVNELLTDIADSDVGNDIEVLSALADAFDNDLDDVAGAAINKTVYFYSDVHSDQDLGVEYVEECYPSDIEIDIAEYARKKYGEVIGNSVGIDYEDVGRALRLNYGFTKVKDGYIEIV